MTARVEVYRGHDRQWYWRKRAGNHRIVAQGEGYRTRWGAKRGARRANPDVVTFVLLAGEAA